MPLSEVCREMHQRHPFGEYSGTSIYAGNDHSPLSGIVAKGSRLNVLGTELANAHNARVCPGDQIAHSDGLVSDVEQTVSSERESGTFPLELEDDETIIVTSSEQVEGRMSGQDPESVMLPSESLHSGPLGHVPDPNRLVFSIRENQLVTRVEDTGRDIVEVTSAGVNFPSLGV